jgi:hypothetical protein
MVHMAFDVLDKDRSGVVTLDELAAAYDVSSNPDVISGKKTKKEALRDFILQWDTKDKDDLVTLEEFEDYYKGVSASIDGDDYFELMIRNAWRIAGGQGMCANTANRFVICDNAEVSCDNSSAVMRRRVLVTNKDGSQSVQTITNELGLKAGDIDGIRSRLAQQGIQAQDIGLYAGSDSREPGKGKMPQVNMNPFHLPILRINLFFICRGFLGAQRNLKRT